MRVLEALSFRLVCFIFVVASLVFPARGQALNLGSLISDAEFTNFTSMSLERIRTFLNSRGGNIVDYFTSTDEGVVKSGAEIIYDAATNHHINPKVLIVKLQSESSSVVQPRTPSQLEEYVMGYGVCDSCSKDDPKVAVYRGFYNQIDGAAGQFRKYLDESQNYHYRAGITADVDGLPVTIENQASAALLNYTPHAHGNSVFHELYALWFTRKYPDGTLLQVDKTPGVYVVQNGMLRPFLSRSAFAANYNFREIIKISATDLEPYEKGAPIKFAEGTLLQDKTSGGVYLYLNGEKRPIASRDVFRQLGFNPEELIIVDPSELESTPTGEKITAADNYPTGALIQSAQTGGIKYVENGIASPIYSKEILKNRFPNKRVLSVDGNQFEAFIPGDPLKFRDGTLVTAPDVSSVYLISNGERRPFRSAEIFKELGYSWNNLIRTNLASLDIHPLGESITLE
jgi:hypothetical protein